MNDLISRQAVLKLLSTIPPEEAMTKAMLIQSVKQMDSETVTECNNLISRRAAIYAVAELTSSMSICTSVDECHGMKRMQGMAVRALEGLPSAQPEDCDTCKHGYFGDSHCDNCRVRYPSHYERRTE